jgi:hypothetical protein
LACKFLNAISFNNLKDNSSIFVVVDLTLETRKKSMKKLSIIFVLAFALFVGACDKLAEKAGGDNSNSDKKEPTPATQVSEDGFVASGTGTEKAKPESGKANVQGKVMFNEKAVENIEVKLCEKFSTFSGCGGETFTSKTDKDGEYLIANVNPKEYQGLIVKVFDTKSFVFASNRFGITASKYKIEADKTFFAPDTNLFKSDLKIVSPKLKAKVDAKALEIAWEAYEGAAYYKVGMYASDPKTTSPYVNEKVEGTSFKGEKPLTNGEYRIKIDAFNANNVKLSELSEDVKFNIIGGEEKPAAEANK